MKTERMPKTKKMKKFLKISVDVLMMILFIYLLSYQPGMGLMAHAVLGISLFVLFILHHLLNLAWYKTMFKGKYNFRRGLLTGINILLLLVMIILMISSLMISGMVFPISLFPVSSYWRNIHVASAACEFILVAIHLGLHVHGVIGKLENRLKMKGIGLAGYLVEFMILVFGCYSLAQLGLIKDIFMIQEYPLPISEIMFFAESIGIVLAVCLAVHYFLNFLNIFSKK